MIELLVILFVVAIISGLGRWATRERFKRMYKEILGWLWVAALIWCCWEFFTAPSYPPDYQNEENTNDREHE